MKKVSFVIPIHNLDKWLSNCLDSVLKQHNIDDCEIILVDDGSVDCSKDICLKYIAKYSFIKYFYIDNSGVSFARNFGLKHACGEYVCFLDGDDFYLKDFVDDFYLICKNNDLDIIRGRCSTFDETTNNLITYETKINFFNVVLSGKNYLHQSLKYKANEVVPWLGFFRRTFLLQHGILFPENIAYEEDHLFFLEALLVARRVMVVDQIFYAYRYRKDSASKKYSVNQVIDALAVIKKEFNLASTQSDRILKKDIAKYCSASFYQITSIYGRVSKEERKLIRKEVKNCRFNVFTFKSYCSIHQMIKIIFFLSFPRLIALAYLLRKK